MTLTLNPLIKPVIVLTSLLLAFYGAIPAKTAGFATNTDARRRGRKDCLPRGILKGCKAMLSG